PWRRSSRGATSPCQTRPDPAVRCATHLFQVGSGSIVAWSDLDRGRGRGWAILQPARIEEHAHTATHRISSDHVDNPLAALPCRRIDENRGLVALNAQPPGRLVW